MANGKSVFIAYVLWLFGGIFGFHHFYLRRDAHGFLMLTTYGGYGMAWLSDFTKIPRYVRDANDDPRFIEELVQKVRRSNKPPFSLVRFISAVMVGYFWGQLVMKSIPEGELNGIDWSFLQWLVPCAAATGIWVVGNIGRQQGSPWIAIIVAYLSYLLKWCGYCEGVWFNVMLSASAVAFDSCSKQWRKKPQERRTLVKRVLILSLCLTLHNSMWCADIYFNEAIIDSNGDEISVFKALLHFTFLWWTDLIQSLYETYQFGQRHGWHEVWKQIKNLINTLDKRNNAYEVLDLYSRASKSEITAKWRHLSRQWHPDKVKDPALQRVAQERFMEIQQAYEILSNIKTKRKRVNKNL